MVNKEGVQAQVGNIVEYPLRSIETADFNDGRSHGVGLLVSRNIDRGTIHIDRHCSTYMAQAVRVG